MFAYVRGISIFQFLAVQTVKRFLKLKENIEELLLTSHFLTEIFFQISQVFTFVETSAGSTRERRNISAEIVRSEIVLKRRRVLRYLIIRKIRNG